MRSSIVLAVAIFLAVSSRSESAAPSVIAGSDLNAPPAFWVNSFWGITANIDRAFSFAVLPGGPYWMDELQIAAFHYQSQTGNSASFSIHEDTQGEPGVELASLLITSITTTAEVHTLVPSEELMLHSNVLYWIVGQTSQQQVNWNLGDRDFGQIAYRVGDGAWTVEQNRNVSAYAILGTAVPEPASNILLAVVVFAPLCIRTRKGSRRP